MPLSDAQKAKVRDAALSWVGTPYRHGQRVKGPQGGVDCATFLIGVFADAGLIEAFEPGYYPPDWHLHVSDERYLQHVLQYADEAAPPWEVGDVLMFRGRVWPSAGHGAIYLGDGQVIHAIVRRQVEVWPLDGTPLLTTTLWKGFRFRV